MKFSPMVDGPYKKPSAWRRNIYPAICFLLFCAAVFLACWSFVRGCTPDPDFAWVTKGELSRLQRYHGAYALKITESAVYIQRDGKWIPVKRREYGI